MKKKDSEISKEFKKAVESGNKRLVRIMLKDLLIIDRSFKTFDANLKYANSFIKDLFDNDKFESPLEITKNSLNLEMVSLVNEFTKERIDWCKKAISEIYK